MLRVVLLLPLILSLFACSSTPEWKGLYDTDKEETENNLEVPPDLTQPSYSDNLGVPTIADSGTTYSRYSTGGNQSGSVLAAEASDVKVVRDGKEMWLEVEETPDSIWSALHGFFANVGFEIKRENKKLGVMETNFVENRYNVEVSWFSSIFGGFMSSGLKDKYRARVEKTDKPGVVRLFITHQGMKEEATDDTSGSTFIRYWVMRESEPELEAEMYQRFIVYRGMGSEAAKKLAVDQSGNSRTEISEKDGTKILLVKEGFARTWRRVGIALDRMGLYIEDRNRTGGLFYIRLTDHYKEASKKENSWFAGLFSSGDKKLKDRYLINIEDKGELSVISLYEPEGTKADAKLVDRVLSDLKVYLD